jgi:hypothetical protein
MSRMSEATWEETKTRVGSMLLDLLDVEASKGGNP